MAVFREGVLIVALGELVDFYEFFLFVGDGFASAGEFVHGEVDAGFVSEVFEGFFKCHALDFHDEGENVAAFV